MNHNIYNSLSTFLNTVGDNVVFNENNIDNYVKQYIECLDNCIENINYDYGKEYVVSHFKGNTKLEQFLTSWFKNSLIVRKKDKSVLDSITIEYKQSNQYMNLKMHHFRFYFKLNSNILHLFSLLNHLGVDNVYGLNTSSNVPSKFDKKEFLETVREFESKYFEHIGYYFSYNFNFIYEYMYDRKNTEYVRSNIDYFLRSPSFIYTAIYGNVFKQKDNIKKRLFDMMTLYSYRELQNITIAEEEKYNYSNLRRCIQRYNISSETLHYYMVVKYFNDIYLDVKNKEHLINICHHILKGDSYGAFKETLFMLNKCDDIRSLYDNVNILKNYYKSTSYNKNNLKEMIENIVCYTLEYFISDKDNNLSFYSNDLNFIIGNVKESGNSEIIKKIKNLYIRGKYKPDSGD